MSRRSNNQFAVSLFSFQDIITSVSGVLILVVLLLILELVQRQSSDSTQKAYQASAHEIRESIEHVNSEMSEISSAMSQSQRLIQLATQNPQGMLNDRIAVETTAVAASNDRIDDLNSISNQVEKAEKETEDKQSRSKEDMRELARVRARTEQLEKELSTLKSGGSSYYSTPDGIDGRLAWVCVLRKRELKLYCMDDGSQNHLIVSSQKEKSAKDLFNQLQSWLTDRRPRIHYLLIAIRPSGSDVGNEMAIRGVNLPVELGFDLIAEEHQLLDSKGRLVP